jgi:hypothetical protein
MRREVLRPLSMRRICGAGITAVAAGAIWLPATAGAAPNVCHIAGITPAVGKMVFPQFAGISGGQTPEATTPPNFGYCDVSAKNLPTALSVELWSASVFKQQATTFDNGKRERLPSLGKGAYYSPVAGNKNEANLIFVRGKYTVLIDPTHTGGASSLYPTKKQYVTLAHAIFKHLR